MEMANQFSSALWISFVTPVFLLSCLYFSLSFFQHLKSGDERRIKLSKWAAVLSLAFALLTPAFYQLYFYYQVMNQY
ncbi:hypothetical protein ACTHOQ_05735 [Solibacillus silvestris]|uniref:hypothetical protein n=1 Tax=Solibacillus silvestris TaxID=76853 RepID=UPI003F7D62B2